MLCPTKFNSRISLALASYVVFRMAPIDPVHLNDFDHKSYLKWF